MAQQTTLKPHAQPGPVYASFAGKTEAAVITAPITLTLRDRDLTLTLRDRDLTLTLRDRTE